MNQNDIARYYWRTGQRWSGDFRSIRNRGQSRLPSRTVSWLVIALLATAATLIRLNA